jgi:uncharacterized protein (DUF849 family)
MLAADRQTRGTPVSVPALIEVALNGGSDRPAPWRPEEAAAEGRRAVEAGAGMVHVHARRDDGEESSDPDWYARFLDIFGTDCPSVPVSFTSRHTSRLIEDVAAWAPTPHVCSVNFGSVVDPWREVLQLLRDRTVVIEAGVADESMIDALYAARCPVCHVVFLVVTADRTRGSAAARYVALRSHAREAGLEAPIVAHGRGDATWGVVGAALAAGDHVRVGLEDSLTLPDGRPAHSNEDLVRCAVRIAESLGRTPLPAREMADLINRMAEAPRA